MAAGDSPAPSPVLYRVVSHARPVCAHEGQEARLTPVRISATVRSHFPKRSPGLPMRLPAVLSLAPDDAMGIFLRR